MFLVTSKPIWQVYSTPEYNQEWTIRCLITLLQGMVIVAVRVLSVYTSRSRVLPSVSMLHLYILVQILMEIKEKVGVTKLCQISFESDCFDHFSTQRISAELSWYIKQVIIWQLGNFCIISSECVFVICTHITILYFSCYLCRYYFPIGWRTEAIVEVSIQWSRSESITRYICRSSWHRYQGWRSAGVEHHHRRLL